MEKEFYETSDINLASALLCLGFDIDGINPANTERVVFYFDPQRFPSVEATAKKYWQNEITVNPKDFMNNRRDLLVRVKESQRSLGNHYD